MKYRYLIFDFDGIIAETNDIRFAGFQELFKEYPKDQVEQLVQYARLNGGLSRYVKIQHFFKEIRNELISEGVVNKISQKYSELVKLKVINAVPVIGSLEFLSSYHQDYDFAIVSGSDENELKEVCKARHIDHLFKEILGAPVDKCSNIIKLLSKRGWGKEVCVFIGDSVNDLNAARAVKIDFIGRNSGLVNWDTSYGVPAVNDLSQLPPLLI